MYPLSPTNTSLLSLLSVRLFAHLHIEERNRLVSVCCAFHRRMVKEKAPVFPLSSILQVTAWVPYWILFSLDLSSQLPLHLNKLPNLPPLPHLPPLPLSPVHLCLDSPLPRRLSWNHSFWVSVHPWLWGCLFDPGSLIYVYLFHLSLSVLTNPFPLPKCFVWVENLSVILLKQQLMVLLVTNVTPSSYAHLEISFSFLIHWFLTALLLICYLMNKIIRNY